MWRWLVQEWQWPAAALFAALFLLAILPPLAMGWGLALTLVFVQLPVYMLHQWEEHAGDRFRLYINDVLANHVLANHELGNHALASGQEALTRGATFWINSLGVWGVNLVALYLAWSLAPAAGLVAGYLTLVNGLVHIVQALARREYNPGLATAAVLFLPIGGTCVALVGAKADLWVHAISLGAAVGEHVLIVAYVLRRLSRLPKRA